MRWQCQWLPSPQCACVHCPPREYQCSHSPHTRQGRFSPNLVNGQTDCVRVSRQPPQESNQDNRLLLCISNEYCRITLPSTLAMFLYADVGTVYKSGTLSPACQLTPTYQVVTIRQVSMLSVICCQVMQHACNTVQSQTQDMRCMAECPSCVWATKVCRLLLSLCHHLTLVGQLLASDNLAAKQQISSAQGFKIG